MGSKGLTKLVGMNFIYCLSSIIHNVMSLLVHVSVVRSKQDNSLYIKDNEIINNLKIYLRCIFKLLTCLDLATSIDYDSEIIDKTFLFNNLVSL